MPVRISRVNVAHPPHRVDQDEAVAAIARLGGDHRRAAAIARGSRIDARATILPPGAIATLGTAGDRNNRYRAAAPELAAEAVAGLGDFSGSAIGCLATTSCTGVALPGWGAGLIESARLSRACARLPITEAGCAGGVVALARAADYLRARPGAAALAVSVELCSLAFHPRGDDGNLTASLIFGDGAGAALLEQGDGPGLELLDDASWLIPASEDLLGFDLTDCGFYPRLDRRLAGCLGPAAVASVTRMLARNALACRDIGAWLVHPGGARILECPRRLALLATRLDALVLGRAAGERQHLIGRHLRRPPALPGRTAAGWRARRRDRVRSRRGDRAPPPAPVLMRLVVCAAMGAARLGELAWSRRNIAAAGPSDEGRWSRATYPLMVVLHTAVILAVALRGRNARPVWLSVLVAVQPLRAWTLATLGRRWNTRAAVPRAMSVATGGPYRFVRHPNYDVVAIELAALPLAFGLPAAALAATAMNAALLAARIPEEERLLARVPGYAETVGRRKRFIPGLV